MKKASALLTAKNVELLRLYPIRNQKIFMTLMQIMYVPGQERVGVTPVCVIVMLHV